MKACLFTSLAAALIGCGCGTIKAHDTAPVVIRDHPFGVYNGVRYDYGWLTDSDSTPQPYGTRTGYIIGSLLDFPLSFLGDTFILPFDIADSNYDPTSFRSDYVH
jgi:uncharacterized protein YceK